MEAFVVGVLTSTQLAVRKIVGGRLAEQIWRLMIGDRINPELTVVPRLSCALWSRVNATEASGHQLQRSFEYGGVGVV